MDNHSIYPPLLEFIALNQRVYKKHLYVNISLLFRFIVHFINNKKYNLHSMKLTSEELKKIAENSFESFKLILHMGITTSGISYYPLLIELKDCKNLQIIKLMVRMENIDVVDRSGYTALHNFLISHPDNHPYLEILLAAGISLEAKPKTGGLTVSDCALHKSCRLCMLTLIKYGLWRDDILKLGSTLYEHINKLIIDESI